MAVRKISLMLPEAAELAAQMRRRTGWLRESETRAISTPIDEAAKQPKGLLTFHCWTDMKAHFTRKYGPPRPSDTRDQWKQKGRIAGAGGAGSSKEKKTVPLDPVLSAGTVLQPVMPPSSSLSGSSDASKV